jgi:AraC family transcriptional regulator of adaptative response/methylated-DNA-[protein]-cysteine methyltransferase
MNMTPSDERWNAVRLRQAGPLSPFLYAVRTTGVYCRPTCGSRLPRRENVQFFEDAQAAERAGFRACRRCRPDADAPELRTVALIAQACRRIEAAEQSPSLADLAAHSGLSRFHFHRLFKRVTGLTPRAYATAVRAQRVRASLPSSSSVTAAIYDAGFGSNGRFYEHSDATLGMAPSRYRAGGAGITIRYALAPCSLGMLLVAATDRGVCAIALGDDPQGMQRDLQRRFPRADLRSADAGFERTLAAVVRCVESPAAGLALPLDLQGTGFQLRVWQALRAIPAGQPVSYGELARRLGVPRASRAVGAAVGANPIAVAVPCHRVIASDGRLSGYHWGVERKRELLEREGFHVRRSEE